MYEQLDPERFQEFAQALLLFQYPNLQCFPVAQKDGGRDAVRPKVAPDAPTVVCQVKFKRRDEEDAASWMIETLEKELPKIQSLIASGADEYVMLTNARGSAHPEVGKIDKVQKWLTDHVTIPAQCLWRDDLDRRVDGAASSLKLRYPSILTGDDTLTLIKHIMSGPRQDEIASAMRAFAAEQFRIDEDVKFRQVELANSLLALFVDVPADVASIIWSGGGRDRDKPLQVRLRSMATYTGLPGGLEDGTDSAHAIVVSTADLLLDAEVQRSAPRVMLQGAPGQGKSTLAQYVCQVHRARYLNRTQFLDALSEPHRSSTFRFPIKVDLRDLASYLDGASYLGQARTENETLSFERFVASVISIQSGGLEFSANDFVLVCSQVPVLLFLDGLDEVADLKLREKLISAVNKALNRLHENGADVQVVVTTRPSLFGRSASFGKDFVRVNLAPISREIIEKYSRKWVVARGLSSDRAIEVQSILNQKLDLGHVKELTKNPMQLTILLSLIQSIGHSLPDVRTDLYSEYVNLFMTREAEKSAIVRTHRSLLSEIVEYVAWTLQAGAEADRSAGSISETELKHLISRYLSAGRHEQGILDDLFEKGIERVWVLVQRVEGLYEFEVQPLREFFAAKYLYETAPHSSRRHREVHGDRSQRFEAMAINPYWSNVTRFYAGFYTSGEIGALSESLRELVASKNLAKSLTARAVGAALLADWVFKTKKYIQDQVVELVFDPIGVELLASARATGAEVVKLDRECGRDTLARLLFERHVLGQSHTSAPVVSLLSRNGGWTLWREFREWVAESTGAERTRRFNVAATAGALAQHEDVEALILDDSPDRATLSKRVVPLLRGYQDLLARSEQLAMLALHVLLESGGKAIGSVSSDIGYLNRLLDGDPFQVFLLSEENYKPSYPVREAELVNVRSVVELIASKEHSFRTRDFQLEPKLWIELVASLETALGEQWAIYRLAVVNAGLFKLGTQVERDLADPSITLFERALIARQWRGKSSWWHSRIEESVGDERLFWLALVLAWAPSRTLKALVPVLGETLVSLSDDAFLRLTEALIVARRSRGGKGRAPIALEEGTSARLSQALYFALGAVQLPMVVGSALDDIRIQRAIERAGNVDDFAKFPGWDRVRGRKQIQVWVDKLAAIASTEAGLRLRHADRSPIGRSTTIPSNVAQILILEHRGTLPRVLAMLAYQSILADYACVAVRTVAESEAWTFD
ncbi:NACHT domain-containing NTPase [Rathayibacter sp. AY1H3]|uniref:NACHT domain-containing protein n=1 Tax=Rathayibacter sp. AY1H3 TaxID=2080567 RepID=UPI0015E4906E|nr:NACHT domain-containing protein [Rathayibacter sp. AY1H3]